jgi:hypothetical protein
MSRQSDVFPIERAVLMSNRRAIHVRVPKTNPQRQEGTIARRLTGRPSLTLRVTANSETSPARPRLGANESGSGAWFRGTTATGERNGRTEFRLSGKKSGESDKRDQADNGRCRHSRLSHSTAVKRYWNSGKFQRGRCRKRAARLSLRFQEFRQTMACGGVAME